MGWSSLLFAAREGAMRNVQDICRTSHPSGRNSAGLAGTRLQVAGHKGARLYRPSGRRRQWRPSRAESWPEGERGRAPTSCAGRRRCERRSSLTGWRRSSSAFPSWVYGFRGSISVVSTWGWSLLMHRSQRCGLPLKAGQAECSPRSGTAPEWLCGFWKRRVPQKAWVRYRAAGGGMQWAAGRRTGQLR